MVQPFFLNKNKLQFAKMLVTCEPKTKLTLG